MLGPIIDVLEQLGVLPYIQTLAAVLVAVALYRAFVDRS